MRTETAKRCITELQRFLKAWQNVQVKHEQCSDLPYATKLEDWLHHDRYVAKERAALRRASLDLSQALET